MMKQLQINDLFIKREQYRGNSEIEEVEMFDTIAILSSGAFRECSSLKSVFFGLDISRIGHGAFQDCKSLKDVWFEIIDENKFIEIAEDAFDGCPKDITFHIFASATKNKYLNDYAKRHGFKVVGMM